MSGPGVARLYYDGGCGPCSFFARASLGLGRGRVEIIPLGDRQADPDLGGLSPEVRESSFHLKDRGRLVSGENAILPWVGVTLGPRIERGVARIPPTRYLLVRLYRRLWEARRRSGCARPS